MIALVVRRVSDIVVWLHITANKCQKARAEGFDQILMRVWFCIPFTQMVNMFFLRRKNLIVLKKKMLISSPSNIIGDCGWNFRQHFGDDKGDNKQWQEAWLMDTSSWMFIEGGFYVDTHWNKNRILHWWALAFPLLLDFSFGKICFWKLYFLWYSTIVKI